MKRILIFLALLLAAYVSFSQSPIYGRLRVISGLYDNYFQNGTDTFKLGWRTDRFQLKYNTDKRFIDFIKADSSTVIYNKLILESPNDTMLSVRGVSSLNGVVHINDTVYMSGNFINSEPAYLFTGYVDSSSFVWGKTSTARARWSFSIGDGSSSEGAFGFASGNSVNTGIYGFSVNNSGNSGLKGFTSNVGLNNGESGTAVNNSENYGKWSFSANTGIVFAENASGFGLNTFNRAFSSFVIGAYNDTVGSHMYDGTSWVYSEPLFIIGNGIANHDNDAFKVLKNGKTFIGDSSDVTDAILVVDPTDSTSTFIGTVSVEKSLQVGNNTADTSLIVNGNLKADTIFSTNCHADTLVFSDGTKQTTATTGGGASYLKYVAILNQTGTDAPTAIELENTTGATISFVYSSVGSYELNASANVFPELKTVILLGASTNSIFDLNTCYYNADNQLKIDCINVETHLLSDETLYNTAIEIRVYP